MKESTLSHLPEMRCDSVIIQPSGKPKDDGCKESDDIANIAFYNPNLNQPLKPYKYVIT